MSNSTSTNEHGVRELRAGELEAVNGGIIGGCIRLPSLIGGMLPTPPGPFVDQFAMKLPSWVHPL